jgi:ketosteroid isomerase-like protein
MSHENVEIVKAAIDANNREDWDALFKDAAPGAELDVSRAVGPWRGVYGLDQIRRVVGEFPRELGVRSDRAPRIHRTQDALEAVGLLEQDARAEPS